MSKDLPSELGWGLVNQRNDMTEIVGGVAPRKLRHQGPFRSVFCKYYLPTLGARLAALTLRCDRMVTRVLPVLESQRSSWPSMHQGSPLRHESLNRRPVSYREAKVPLSSLAIRSSRHAGASRCPEEQKNYLLLTSGLREFE
jgi:hypothetical protein